MACPVELGDGVLGVVARLAVLHAATKLSATPLKLLENLLRARGAA